MKAFSIGRHSSNNFVIGDDSVSGKHAEVEISKHYKTFILKDLDSTNGTKVNDRTILTKEVSAADKIKFGNIEVDSLDFWEHLTTYVTQSRQDFQEEFQRLKTIEDRYTDKRNRINKYYKLRSSLPKIILTLAVIVAISFLDIDNDLRYIIIIITGFLGTVLTTLSISEKKKLAILEDLKIEFQLNFICPKCKKELSHNKWRYWKEKKTCPNCKCNWT